MRHLKLKDNNYSINGRTTKFELSAEIEDFDFTEDNGKYYDFFSKPYSDAESITVYLKACSLSYRVIGTTKVLNCHFESGIMFIINNTVEMLVKGLKLL